MTTPNYWYDHKCDNHEPKELCLTCDNYSKPYCKNIYSEYKHKEKSKQRAGF